MIFRQILYLEGKTLKHALELLDRISIKVLLVTNFREEFVGVMTDGDVRRAILMGASLETSVSEIANYNPIYLEAVLMQLTEQNNIPVEIKSNINSDEFMDRVKKYQVDIFVSISFNQIIKEEMIHCPPLKTINCHTRDIILQKTYSISDEDNYQTVLERAYVGCADVLWNAPS